MNKSYDWILNLHITKATTALAMIVIFLFQLNLQNIDVNSNSKHELAKTSESQNIFNY